MKIKFEAQLDYQLDAIRSVCELFTGQQNRHAEFSLNSSPGTLKLEPQIGVGNQLDLPEEELLENLQSVQLRNGLPISSKLPDRNFTIEMETGTGKTYVYLRSLFELNKKYGFTKFIVVVPSIAIKEGTNKALEMTRSHFGELYQNVPYDFFTYDSSKLEQLRSFATSTTIQIMVINIDAFRRSFTDPARSGKANLIHRQNDRLNGHKPIDFIASTNPVVIIDEPQSVDNTSKAKEAMASLNPLFTLRYSATHKERYNVVYKLDAVDAYDRKLVKQIEVASFQEENYHNQAYIRLIQVDNKNGYRARIEIDVNQKGKLKRCRKWVKANTDLAELSKRPIYEGYIVKDIGFVPGNEYIDFTSKPDLIYMGKAIGTIDDLEIKRLQIRKTIEEHLNKETLLTPKGIKVLSLFFIDKVSNYRQYNEEGEIQKGRFAKIFEEEYLSLIQHPRFDSLFQESHERTEPVDKIHNGYFSIDRRRQSSKSRERYEVFTDSTGKSGRDEDAFNLIMKDKEKLLSFSSPLRFIFSHSALREGWDNPNVFQICTLNETRSEDKKRQEIGRGLRICVNQEGNRVYGFETNTLTVMANESYLDFVTRLQKEIEEDTGLRFGVIEAHSFANLLVERQGEKSQMLGIEKSRDLRVFLEVNGFVDCEGKVQDKLQLALKENNLDLPPEYEVPKDAILATLRKVTGGLRVRDARKKKLVTLNKERFLSPEFKNLWDRIKFKTKYSVQFDSKVLANRCAEQIQANLQVTSGKLVFHKAKTEIARSGIKIRNNSETHEAYAIAQQPHRLPDVIGYIQNETDLTRKSIARILIQSNRLDAFQQNPQKFIDGAIDIIKTEMRHFIVGGIKYTRIGDAHCYRQELFETEELYGHVTQNMVESTRSPFNYTLYDSEVERSFALQLEAAGEVKLYTKLPSWFEIQTPLGGYNPDWAVLWEQNGVELLYFIVETKGALSWESLRPVEKGKIECGKKHFEALDSGVALEVAVGMDDLRNYV